MVFFMLFGHSELDSGRQACKKIKKKSFELDLSKEALFGQNGGGGAESCPWEEVRGPVFLAILAYNVFS